MSYRKRLTADLDRWIERGLVPGANRTAILADIAPARAGWSASGAAAILGAVLLSFAAISFVAANWDAIPRMVRFALLLVALWASFAGSGAAFVRNNRVAGHALAVLGAALFGAAIALTAQTFNMSAFRNTGILIWTAGALVTAVIIPSRPVLILAALLGAFWAGSEAMNPLAPGQIWGYAPVWLVTAGLAWRLKSAITLHLLGLALLVWAGHLIMETTGGAFSDQSRAAVYALIIGALAMVFAALRDREVFGAGVLASWLGAGALAAGFVVQNPDLAGDTLPGALYWTLTGAGLVTLVLAASIRTVRGGLALGAAIAFIAGGLAAAALPAIYVQAPDGGAFFVEIAAGAAIYAAAVALILIGARPGHRAAGVLGVIAFIAETLYVYGALFGGLLSTSVFFAAGGLLLLAVSVLISRVARRIARPAREGDAS
ncbi:DUF2157 domain-containing protein [Maricaulaceae bacterium MS644]